ncbi:SpoIIE family protein phosphatase [Halolactibacillus sp. JCM 19043]|uniref:SpoIIE family protein phosphatase n=1 Tax=Halolactibacillus sp. JCM 19043 TaxID=1460638 RepID=UPI0018CFEF79|nr:SpoIIE family protein phosphatase [Halolactibacillus sp. JCM 19043]
MPYYLYVYARDQRHGRVLLIVSLLSSYTAGDSMFYLMMVRLVLFILCERFGLFERRAVIPFVLGGIQLISHLMIEVFIQPLSILTIALASMDAILTGAFWRLFREWQHMTLTVKTKLTHEQIFSLLVLMFGLFSGLDAYSWSMFHPAVLSGRFIVFVLGYSGGMLVGATFGVVTGVLFSFLSPVYSSEIILLATLGIISGVLKGKPRIYSVGLGTLTTLLYSLYFMEVALLSSVVHTVMSGVLLLLIPKKQLKSLALLLPTTDEAIHFQQRYLKDLRKVTSAQMSQFADIFNSLSESIEATTSPPLDDVCLKVMHSTCQSCLKYDWCFGDRKAQTIDELMTVTEALDDGMSLTHIEASLPLCIKKRKVISEMKEAQLYQRLKHDVTMHQRQAHLLVKDQLKGVSQVMGNFAEEVMKEGCHYEKQEQDILKAIKQLGIKVENLSIYSLETGNIDIELTIIQKRYFDEAAKLIAPLLSDILAEVVIVHDETINTLPHHQQFFNFKSARNYTLTLGVSHAAKGGGFISGDSYQMMDVSQGKYVLAISDGMGNGRKAQKESMRTLELLNKILQSGMDEVIAIQSINQLLSLRQDFDMYATLDLAMIDLQSGKLQCVKVGAATSFVKRKQSVDTLTSSNLPIGIIQDVEVDKIDVSLNEGDLLIMMSDGIIEKREDHVHALIQNLRTTDPQAIADLLLDGAIIDHDQTIADDMTVIVARLDRFESKWQTIPYQAIEQYSYG